LVSDPRVVDLYLGGRGRIDGEVMVSAGESTGDDW
jgi:hypothetical protein